MMTIWPSHAVFVLGQKILCPFSHLSIKPLRFKSGLCFADKSSEAPGGHVTQIATALAALGHEPTSLWPCKGEVYQLISPAGIQASRGCVLGAQGLSGSPHMVM